MIEVLGLLCEWVIYCCYFGAKKPHVILSFIIHKNAYDRWAFLQMKTMLLRMNKRLGFNIKFIFSSSMSRRITQSDGTGKVNASYSGSISKKITFFINPYKIFKNDSNGHDCYFRKYYYFSF